MRRATSRRSATQLVPGNDLVRAHERAKLMAEIESALRGCPQRQLFEVERLRRRVFELQTGRDCATREAMPAAECRSVRRVRRRLEGIDRQLTCLSDRVVSMREQIASARACVASADTRLTRAALSARLVSASGESRVPLVDDSLSVPVLAAPAADAQSKPAEPRDGPPPETRLLVAVLDQAIDSLRKNKPQKTRRERRLYREVLDWLAQPDDAPFSFEYICTVLNLDPDYIRRGVLGSDWRRELARPLAAAR